VGFWVSALEGLDVIRPDTALGPVGSRTSCRICGAADLELVVDYGAMPLAGGFVPADDSRASETFPLRLLRCRDCTLMQVPDQVPPDRIFAQYSYASSVNRTLVAHFESVAKELVELAAPKGGLIVEFGCNDGILLRPLCVAGARVLGVDPSDVARRSSDEQGWPLVPAYFGLEVAGQVRASYGPARIVTGNNVCAHVDDPNMLVAGVTALLEPEGLFVFEVHYQGDLIELTQYDTVYHEHTCYYSLTSIVRLLARHEMKVVDVRRITIHSGSIHVTAARADSRRGRSASVDEMLATESSWDVARFAERVEVRRASLRILVGDLVEAGRRVVGYGASGRATVLLNFCGLTPDVVRNVSDLSPLRYGKVVPGVKIPVVPRRVFHEDRPDYAILTAWNYEAEIVRDEQTFLRTGGRFIVPLPDVRLVGAA
jgi:predicted TPR repeat methyltransferase